MLDLLSGGHLKRRTQVVFVLVSVTTLQLKHTVIYKFYNKSTIVGCIVHVLTFFFSFSPFATLNVSERFSTRLCY